MFRPAYTGIRVRERETQAQNRLGSKGREGRAGGFGEEFGGGWFKPEPEKLDKSLEGGPGENVYELFAEKEGGTTSLALRSEASQPDLSDNIALRIEKRRGKTAKDGKGAMGSDLSKQLRIKIRGVIRPTLWGRMIVGNSTGIVRAKEGKKRFWAKEMSRGRTPHPFF